MKTFFFFLTVLVSLLTVSCSKVSYPDTMKAASAKAQEGKWKEAEKLSARVAAMEPESAEALLLHGLALEKCGRQNDGCEELRKARSLAPESYHANYHLGRILCEQHRFDSAITPLTRALQIRKNDPNALILFAEACFQMKKYRESLGCYGLLVRLPEFQKNPQIWTSIGAIYLAQNNVKEAEKCFAYVCRLDPKNPGFAVNYAVFLDRARRKSEAAAWYRNAASLMAGDASSAEKQARIRDRIHALTR